MSTAAWVDTYGAYTDYQSVINRHIKPPMEGLRMRDVRPDDINRMMKRVTSYSKSIHDKTYMLAKQIFTNAFENGIIKSNPCPKMHAGGRDPEERQASVYKGYKRDKIEMRGDRAEMSDFPLYLNTVAGGLDRRDQAIGGFSFVVKIYAVPVVEIIGQLLYLLGRYGFDAQFGDCL